MKKLLFASAFLTFSFLFISVLNPDSANAAVCKGECRFYADGCKPGFLETSGECDAPYICCEQKPSPTPKPPGPACKGRCEFYADGCDNDELQTSGQCDVPLICCEKKDSLPDEKPSPTPSIKPGDNKCAGSCRYYADGCLSGDIQTSGKCDGQFICCEKKGSGTVTPTPKGPVGDCQGKCEYYLEGCGFGLKVSNNSCGSDKLLCCEPQDGVIDPKLGTYIPDCSGTWAPEDIPCAQEGVKNGPMPGFTCCQTFPNSTSGGFNPYTDPEARKALELYGYWYIPENKCYGKCEWGSTSCSIFGKLPAYGQCSGEKQGAPVACCGETIANAGQGSCFQGNSYCASGETSQVTACRVDKKGYIKIQCADGYFCPPGGSHCIPNLTAADLLNPQKGKLFDACKWDFECASNYCDTDSNKCVIDPNEISNSLVLYNAYIKNYQGESIPYPLLYSGWSGLDPKFEGYINNVLEDIIYFEDYCSGPYPNFWECFDSVTTGISMASLIAAPKLLPDVPDTLLKLKYIADNIPRGVKIVGAVIDAVGTGVAILKCEVEKDPAACAILRDWGLWNHTASTATFWNNMPGGSVFDQGDEIVETVPQYAFIPEQKAVQFAPGTENYGFRTRDSFLQWIKSQGIKVNFSNKPVYIPQLKQYAAGSAVVGSREITFYGTSDDIYNTVVAVHEYGHATAQMGQITADYGTLQSYIDECNNCKWTIRWLLNHGYPRSDPYIYGQADYLQKNVDWFLDTLLQSKGLRNVNGQFVSGPQLHNIAKSVIENPSLLQYVNITEGNYLQNLTDIVNAFVGW